MSEAFVHYTAEVSGDSWLGDDVKVWNQVQIREGVIIGDHTSIGKNSYLDRNVRIGKNVKLQNNVNVYEGVTVEDDVFLGPSMTFTNDRYPRAFSTEWEIAETRVKRGASICANATIRCGITIGEYAMIGAGSVVTRDVMDHALVVGNPAKQIGWVCDCGRVLGENGYCGHCGKQYDFASETAEDNNRAAVR